MKAHFLPEHQQARNDQIVKRLRRITVFVVVLTGAWMVAGATLYFRPPSVPISPMCVAADSGTVLGDAVFPTPQFALCLGDGPPQVLAGPIVARKVHAERVTDTAMFTLYRLEGAIAGELPTPTVVEPGQPVTAINAGVSFRGVVRSLDSKEVAVDPDVTVVPGVAVYLESDRQAIVGVTAPVGNRTGILPISAVLSSFAELGGTR
jgi:hypothetical protein